MGEFFIMDLKQDLDLFLLQILLNPNKYVNAVKIQNMFNMTNSLNKFIIQTGVRGCDTEQYSKYTKDKTPKQIIEEYKLGKVGEHKW